MAIAGAFLCVLRARFFRFDVLRFGTAMCAQSVEKRFSARNQSGESVVRAARRFQFGPACIDCGRAAACAGVELGPTGRTESLAILAAHGKMWNREKPLLAYRRAQVQRPRFRSELVDLRIVDLI